MSDSDVMILGAGLAGLGCAHELPGARIFEGAPHPGGHAYSHEVDGVYFDEGAHICHAKDPDWLKRLYEAAGKVEKIGISRISSHWKKQWITYPVQNNLHELPVRERIEALKGFVNALSDRGNEEPAHYLDWCRTQYGDFLTEEFYKVYTDKYWRVPMEQLGTDWLGGRLLPSQIDRIIEGAFGNPMESQAVFAQFHYPAKGGFYAFFRPMFEQLNVAFNKRVVELRPNKRAVVFDDGEVVSYGRLATSIPLPAMIGMIPDAPKDIRRAARLLRHIQLLCVNIIVDRPNMSPYHWFYVYDQDIDVSRVKVNSNVAPQSVPAGRTALQCEIFRRMDEPLPVEELADKAVRDMGKLLGFDPERDVRVMQPVLIPHAYVVSDLHRADAVDILIPWLEAQDIYPMGLFGRWKFIWSDAAYQSGSDLGRRLRSTEQ